MNADEDMRKVSTPFANMLERTRATSLWLRHLNKKENLRGMYRGGGSIAIVGRSSCRVRHRTTSRGNRRQGAGARQAQPGAAAAFVDVHHRSGWRHVAGLSGADRPT